MGEISAQYPLKPTPFPEIFWKAHGLQTTKRYRYAYVCPSAVIFWCLFRYHNILMLELLPILLEKVMTILQNDMN